MSRFPPDLLEHLQRALDRIVGTIDDEELVHGQRQKTINNVAADEAGYAGDESSSPHVQPLQHSDKRHH
ncbi:MAG: hypothetical protein A3I61_01315 [Acidobacteria bacterium RIFCSPLOWO2_02_FULL_68_18]|nr:MAG: hypothetical protein A3I61_01315 [Acidobacteria bacterium RIFCSPLOWO2_02_FULL_68_18]